MFKWPADRFQLKSLSEYVQPASIDLPVSGNVFLVRDKILPFRRKVADLLQELVLEERSLKGEGAVLLKGQTYLIHVGEIELPPDARGCLSAKSSIGRVDLMVRGIVDDCGLYDTIPGASRRDFWLEVSPRSFNVRIREGLALTQLMIFRKAEAEPIDLSGVVFNASGQQTEPQLHRGSLVLSLRVPPVGAPEEIVGYEAIATNEVIDLANIGGHDPSRFFRPIGTTIKDERLTLEKDRFYILATKEYLSISPDLSAEMVPFSQHVGELRAHYAGFFDPGFGSSGEHKGVVGVLEVRPHETITIYDGQPIALMDFFRNSQQPEKPYGLSGNNYQGQKGPKLAKYFKSCRPY
jgi:dCTP deaminase